MVKDVAYMIKETRAIANIGNNKTDEEVLEIIERARQDFIDLLKIRLKGTYFTIPLTTTLERGEYRYKFEPPADSPVGMDMVEQVEVMWKSTDKYYSKILKGDLGQYRESEEYLINELDTDCAFWDLNLDAINIYPAPKETVVRGVRVLASIIYPPLELGGTQDTIFPYHPTLLNFVDVIFMGARYYAYLER